MKTKTTLAALLLTAVMVTPSYGAEDFFLSGSRAYLHWKQTGQPPQHLYGNTMYFMGSVAGFVEGVHAADYYHFPDGVNHDQLLLVVARYIDQHPQQNHQHFRFLIEAAFLNAFPDSR